MRAFLDFEATSLGRHGVPVEVAWVWEDGREESHLIRPASDWTDWDPKAAAIHGIARETLLAEGEAPAAVAARMLSCLDGHALFASAPSWDGKWLSALLRAGGVPRHALRLRDTDEALAEAAHEGLGDILPPPALKAALDGFLALAKMRARSAPAHRALPDARAELACFRAVGEWAAGEARVRRQAA